MKDKVKDNVQDIKQNVKENVNDIKDNLKRAEGVKRPAVEIPKTSGGMKFRPGLIGGLLLVGAGAYYYFNYMQKPAPVIRPTTNIKNDAQNLLDASNKLAADIKQEGKNIIQSGARVAENAKKEGQHVI